MANPGVEGIDSNDSEYLPMDSPSDADSDGNDEQEIPAEDEVEEAPTGEVPEPSETGTEELGSSEDTPAPEAATALAELEQRLIARQEQQLETGLNSLYRRLRQSSRDTVRGQVNKLARNEIALLEDQHRKGRLSDEALTAAKADVLSSVEERTDQAMEQYQSRDPDIRLSTRTANPQQGVFEQAALTIFEGSGLTGADPESAELNRVELTATDFKGALQQYRDAVEAAKKKKQIRLKSVGKTRVELGKGNKTPLTDDALVRRMNYLLRQNGGTFTEKKAREAEIDKLAAKLDKTK